MIDFLQTVGETGANALRRALLAMTGGGLLVLSAGFAGAALVDMLALQIPRYAALGVIAAALLLGGLLFLAAAGRQPVTRAPMPQSGPLASLAPGGAADWRTALQHALAEDAQDRPARAAALAALAGLILGAMEGISQRHETEVK